MLLNLGNGLDAAVIPSAPRQTKPTADFTDGDLGTLGAQSLHRRLSVILARQGDQLFSGTELQHSFVIGLLELFELFFVLFADIHRC
ncbi:hypothetical protein D3C85_1466920 [compost metagenome]